MAKAKTKAAGTNLPVPQSDAEAEQLVARLGALQRDHAAERAHHDAQVAALEAAFGLRAKVFAEVQGVIVDALNVWATAHRERLTQGGRTKTVQLPTGTLLWREGRYAVRHRGLRNEDVVAAIRARVAAATDRFAEAMRRRRAAEIAALREEIAALEGFLRTRVEPNKEAMLAARELAGTIPGVTVPRGPEEFVVEPLASQIPTTRVRAVA
ncbi:host-nuclease inhibitor Gam family protein [Methylobacterium sp. J-070]|uniref:host-nuclease inhibitor Gam family protein n=1 Tax=Methylobacterium sp. J-070 TaxID=2836650 RepID=UPI001FBAAD7C|nr:host-nuclease inhibitor Gam family protein [Methylobacterium sp. J-070]MCJ2050871.1 host-nuclease inhibitor Gam family protein [Methylobacterium sp. J-070]